MGVSRFRATVHTSLWDNFYKVRVLGRGSFGTAILCKRKRDASLIVLKQLDLQSMTAGDRRSAVKEAELLSILKHENIVTYFGCHSCDGQLFIEMEYCEMGTLANFLYGRSKPLLEVDVLSIFRQIASALSYLEDMSILHRDLKSSNIFVTKNFVLKVGDFGIAKIVSSERSGTSTMIGTPMNFSPEVCEGRRFSFKSDVWAAGCILYEIICLKQVFEGANLAALIRNIVTGSFKTIRGPYSRGLKKLVSSLLHKNPIMRPSACEILETVDALLTERQACPLVDKCPRPSFEEATGYATSVKISARNQKLPNRSLLLRLKTSPCIQLERVTMPYRLRVHQISISKTHVLLLADDAVYQMTRHSVPTLITSLQGKTVVKAVAGDGFSLILCDKGVVMCIGNVRGWTETDYLTTPLIDLPDPHVCDAIFSIDVVDISCASKHVVICCSAGLVYVWGVNACGCLGLGKEQLEFDFPLPVLLPFPRGTEIEKVFCGEDATIFLDKRKRLWACGSNVHKKLGLRKLVVHSPRIVASVDDEVDSVCLSRNSTSIQLSCGKTIIFGERRKSLSSKYAKVRRGKVMDLGNGIIRSQTTSRFDVALTIENQIYFWGKRLRKRSASLRNSRVSRTLSKTSESLKDENIAVSESDVSLMEIIQKTGADSPVILVREPRLVAHNLKQLQSMDGEDELFLQPQLVLALYSSQIHLKQGETISFADIAAFDDDIVYIIMNTNIDQCQVRDQRPDIRFLLRSKSDASCGNMTDLESSFDPEPTSEVPNWLLSEFGRSGEESNDHDDEQHELICLGSESNNAGDLSDISVMQKMKTRLCCVIL